MSLRKNDPPSTPERHDGVPAVPPADHPRDPHAPAVLNENPAQPKQPTPAPTSSGVSPPAPAPSRVSQTPPVPPQSPTPSDARPRFATDAHGPITTFPDAPTPAQTLTPEETRASAPALPVADVSANQQPQTDPGVWDTLPGGRMVRHGGPRDYLVLINGVTYNHVADDANGDWLYEPVVKRV